VLYAKRSGYFRFDSKSATYVATDKAKRELQRLETALGDKEIKKIAIHMQSGGDDSGVKPIDINFSAPRFMEGRLAKLASARDSFFSDLTAEGIDKLEASLTGGERDAALRWLESIIVCRTDMCVTLADLFHRLRRAPLSSPVGRLDLKVDQQEIAVLGQRVCGELLILAERDDGVQTCESCR
jgi:hypothetical protein